MGKCGAPLSIIGTGGALSIASTICGTGPLGGFLGATKTLCPLVRISEDDRARGCNSGGTGGGETTGPTSGMDNFTSGITSWYARGIRIKTPANRICADKEAANAPDFLAMESLSSRDCSNMVSR